MKAGYLVASWINSKIKSSGYNAVVKTLTPKIGGGMAAILVGTVTRLGVTAAASVLAGYLGSGSSLAGPLGFIIVYATGWA